MGPGEQGGAERVLQVVPDLQVGGAGRLVVDLAIELRRRCDVRLLVLTSPCGTALESELMGAGVPISYLRKQPGYHPGAIAKVGQAIAAFRPQVIHTHRGVLRYVSPLRWRRRNIVHTLHSIAQHETDRAGKLLHFAAFRLGVAPVAICGAVAESIRRLYRVGPAATIPNGIRLDRLSRPSVGRADWRAREGLPADAFVLACVARLSFPKGIDIAVRICAGARLRSSGIHLVVAGDGEMRAELAGLAARLGVGERVRFLGERNDVADVLGASDALLIPSRVEGHPITAMEALAAGCPVVGFAVGGVDEIVEHGRTGWVVPAGDEASLIGAIVMIAGDRRRAEQAGAEGRQSASRFSIEVTADRYLQLYRELLAPDGASRAGRRAAW